jgi:hypothetical protein
MADTNFADALAAWKGHYHLVYILSQAGMLYE